MFPHTSKIISFLILFIFLPYLEAGQNQLSSDGRCYGPETTGNSFQLCLVFTAIVHNNKIKLRATTYISAIVGTGGFETSATVLIQDDAAEIENNGKFLKEIIVKNLSKKTEGKVSSLKIDIVSPTKIDFSNSGNSSTELDSSEDDVGFKFNYVFSLVYYSSPPLDGELTAKIEGDKKMTINYTTNKKKTKIKYPHSENEFFDIKFEYSGEDLDGCEMGGECGDSGSEGGDNKASVDKDEDSDDGIKKSEIEEDEDEGGVSWLWICVGVLALVLVIFLIFGRKKKVDKVDASENANLNGNPVNSNNNGEENGDGYF